MDNSLRHCLTSEVSSTDREVVLSKRRTGVKPSFREVRDRPLGAYG